MAEGRLPDIRFTNYIWQLAGWQKAGRRRKDRRNRSALAGESETGYNAGRAA